MHVRFTALLDVSLSDRYYRHKCLLWRVSVAALHQGVRGTNHDDQLGEIYPTMLNELNCTIGVSFSRLHCCGHRGLWARARHVK